MPLVAKYRNQYYWNEVTWYISWFATRLQFIVYVIIMNMNDDIMIVSKKVQFFLNKHGRQSAILDPPDPNFGLEERIVHISTKYNTNMSAGNENFPIMSTDYGRKLNA